ncbi:MAG: 5-formyltetrahydrofolate cyclo-ligase [Desulfurococcaceae archaeon]
MEAGIDVKRVKERIRERIWSLLEQTNAAAFPRPVTGRIPNFKGADRAAEQIATLREWQSAEVIKANPDSPQYYLRLKALLEGKLVVMASPKLQSGFILVNPFKIPRDKYSRAATISGSFKYGGFVKLQEIPKIDVVVTGCVAVDRRGTRLGKGGGFSELEYGILKELRLVDEGTPILTTVHDLQVVEDTVPIEVHDLTVDFYATPTRLVKTSGGKYRPQGVYWELLTPSLRSLGVIRELIALRGYK